MIGEFSKEAWNCDLCIKMEYTKAVLQILTDDYHILVEFQHQMNR